MLMCLEMWLPTLLLVNRNKFNCYSHINGSLQKKSAQVERIFLFKKPPDDFVYIYNIHNIMVWWFLISPPLSSPPLDRGCALTMSALSRRTMPKGETHITAASFPPTFLVFPRHEFKLWMTLEPAILLGTGCICQCCFMAVVAHLKVQDENIPVAYLPQMFSAHG